MTHLFAFGLGYSARALAALLARDGWNVSGTATTAEGAGRIADLGYDAHVFDGRAPSASVSSALATATHVVVSVPPGDGGDPVLTHHASDLAGEHITWIGYLSTIGVYGDRNGEWCDECTEPAPTSDRSRRRLDAEQAWFAFAERTGRRVEVFRLAGIYGPGRSAIDNLEDGTARCIVKSGQVFNRIHVADIAHLLRAAVDAPPSHAIFNVTDDEPAPPQDVVAYAAGLLGVPVPPDVAIENAGLSAMGLSFYAENKRVRNARIKEALGLSLLYPTYREGLAAIAAERR
ncbi:MAG: SDR family oxidoreductase [Hyphomicrobium sp.]|nr:SDR family oxidoreductase [Hyphomicrobium sp.]